MDNGSQDNSIKRQYKGTDILNTARTKQQEQKEN
jgi:hypothetical protein